jgi:pyruvate,water dikinase
MTLIAWFEELGKDDVAIVGGKGANLKFWLVLGELARAGLPVPTGFVVTAEAYLRAMEEGGYATNCGRLRPGLREGG